MDVEDFLKQKRELERKKEILEAKERLKEDKEEPKRSVQRPEPHRPEPVRQDYQQEPTIKPWMIWDMIMLVVVIGLFSTAYFFPRYDDARIKAIIALDNTLLTGNVVAQSPTTETEAEEELEEQAPPVMNNNVVRETPPAIEEDLPGPEFSLSLRDVSLGEFDRDGKIDGNIIEITTGGRTRHYTDLILTVQNEEQEVIKCEVEKDLKIDTNFDGTSDARDFRPVVATLEIDPSAFEEKRESIPGDPEEGSYDGRGRISADYTATCVFCLDPECNRVESRGTSEKNARAIVIMRAANSTSP